MSSNEKPQHEHEHEHDALHAQVPADFPHTVHFGALPGTQPKFLMTKYQGRFYLPGSSPLELYEQWVICEEYASQLVDRSIESKAGRRAHMSEQEILEQYCVRFIATGWVPAPQARWVIRRVAQLLNWPAPTSSLEPSANV